MKYAGLCEVNLGEIYDNVIQGKGEKYFRKFYHILTNDYKEIRYNAWLDYLIDKYTIYRGNKKKPLNSKMDSEAFAIADGLEELLYEHNKRFQGKNK